MIQTSEQGIKVKIKNRHNMEEVHVLNEIQLVTHFRTRLFPLKCLLLFPAECLSRSYKQSAFQAVLGSKCKNVLEKYNWEGKDLENRHLKQS